MILSHEKHKNIDLIYFNLLQFDGKKIKFPIVYSDIVDGESVICESTNIRKQKFEDKGIIIVN